MPAPPKPGESKDEFMSRCMAYMAENESDRPRDQRAAICNSMWDRNESKGEKKSKS